MEIVLKRAQVVQGKPARPCITLWRDIHGGVTAQAALYDGVEWSYWTSANESPRCFRSTVQTPNGVRRLSSSSNNHDDCVVITKFQIEENGDKKIIRLGDLVLVLSEENDLTGLMSLFRG